MSAEQGSLVEPLAVGVHAVRRARMAPGATVVIVGAGTIGLMALLAAQALGADKVHVVARHAHQAAAARTFGATTAVQAEGDEAVWLVRDLTDGVGADLVVEAVGRHDFEVAIEIIASGRVRTDGMVTHRFPLEQAAAAFQTAADKSSGSLKVHIRP